MSHKRRIAIIPARGGSKRIAKKNIKEFNGSPLIKYSIEAAINSNIFDRIIVSTDDNDIAEISLNYGAEVPFFRSKETSDDYSTLGDVIYEALQKMDLDEKNLDYICCILPTAPFITKEFLIRAKKIFNENNYDSLFPVVKYSYPIWRSLRKNVSSNNFEMVWPEHINTRSQDLEQIYHDAGMFYFLNTVSFLKKRSVFLQNNGCILTAPWFIQDIDDEEDWEHAEIKYNLLEKQNKKLV
tara:strand:+ start:23000 stop:23719 length:720 start_codon:yes stop_codon:yes gene_type:complete